MSESWLQRLVALIAIWFMASAVDQTGDHWWLIFSFLAIALVLEFLAFRKGVATGINLYKNASPTERRDLDRIMESEK